MILSIDCQKADTSKKDHLMSAQFEHLRADFQTSMRRSMDFASERGASTWHENGFALHKGDFKDALGLRYGWKLHHIVFVEILFQ